MKLKLVKFTENYIEKLLSWNSTEEFLFQWAGPTYKFPLDRTQLLNDIEKATEENPNMYIFAAIDEDSAEMVAHIQIMGIDIANDYGHVGRFICDPELVGKGIGTKVMKELQKFAFEELRLHKLGLNVFDYNKSAIRCYEKAGFIIEGVYRDSRKINGEYFSLVNMGILDREYYSR